MKEFLAHQVGHPFGLLLILFFSTLLWGCDSSPSDPPPEEPMLDEELIDVITIGGQRGLENFILPESDAFSDIPQDPRNPLTADKVQLGKLLFHETGLATNPLKESARNTYSCATCHHAGAGFQAGRRQALGEGGSGWGNNGEGRVVMQGYAPEEVDAQRIKSPTVINSAYQELMGWSGKFGVRGPNVGTDHRWEEGMPTGVNTLGYDGLEIQAIAGLGIHRMDSVQNSVVATNQEYQELWQKVFPGEDITVENVGLAIAAYERTMLSNKAPFQLWLRGEKNAMTAAEKRGAKVFFGKALCEACHTGPALNQMEFYALGMKNMEGSDIVGEHVDESLGRGKFSGVAEEEMQFKVPQLYNLVDSKFFGHGSTFFTLREVIDYYNDAIPDIPIPQDRVPHRFQELNLNEAEINDLLEFVSTALYDPDLDRYAVDKLPSGLCTPANDPQARIDLGC